jgi:hypothetical protein
LLPGRLKLTPTGIAPRQPLLLSCRKDNAIAAVREAVERMDGAGWIGVAARRYPPGAAGWVIACPPGRCGTPGTPEWAELRQWVETVATNPLLAAGAPLQPGRSMARARERRPSRVGLNVRNGEERSFP